jgi:ketosteroid isomerase-like protein
MSHEETIRTAYSAWNRDDLEAFLATLHPDIEIHPVLGRSVQADVYRGHDGASRWIAEAKGEWVNFQATVPEVIDRGEKLLTVVRVTAKGRASGALIEGEIFHIGTMRDGLIVKIEGFTDRDAAMRALEAT